MTKKAKRVGKMGGGVIPNSILLFLTKVFGVRAGYFF